MNELIQIFLYIAVLTLAAIPLGKYIARLYATTATPLFERGLYRVSGVDLSEMSWQRYALAFMIFNALGALVVYALQRAQAYLPLNQMDLGAVSPDSSFNTAVSFATNTNWQGYGGETTMSYLTQMLGLTVQNFVSAASGIAVLIALVRGFTRAGASTIGNFWVDLTRATLYVLLPLSLILSLALVSQGVVQTFDPYAETALIEPVEYEEEGKTAVAQTQTIAVGPAASQIAIKQLGTNGGGFFNVNSSHPLENPTPLSNFLEVLAILLIPAALCFTFGALIKDVRQGWAIFSAMLILFAGFLALAYFAEQAGNPLLAQLGIDSAVSDTQAGGNMEGKETRFGIVNSALWATATTAASNGSVNAMHDSFMPLGGLAPMVLMQLGEVVFGGVGSGLYGMLVFAIIAVFVAGLMIGRTPEYLGKKIEAYEMKMAAVVILVPAFTILIGVAIAVLLETAVSSISNPGPHGFSQILYAFSSAGNNNGSAFAGLSANTPFYNTALGLAMWFSRYFLAIPVLAIAGSLAAKKKIPASSGTLPTHTPLFVALLIGTVLIVGALTFIPALALGPVAEHLQLY
ncbi:MAG: potassium-transporting ATPase subunit KdpA [Burkholderiales bacterium]